MGFTSRANAKNPVPGNSLVLDLHLIGVKPKGNFETLIIPIKRVDRLLLVEARIDTMQGNFIIDTGAPDLILNHTYFRKYWVSSDAIASNVGGIPSGPVKNTWIDQLEIRELRFERIKATLTELGHIENRSSIKVLGLLGVAIFKEFSMTIDLQQNVLILKKLDKKGNELSKLETPTTTKTMKIPIKIVNNTIMLQGVVAGKKLNLCLDSGAETNVLNGNVADKVLKKFTLARRSVLLGTGGSKVEVLVGRLDDFTIGTMNLSNLPTVISNLEEFGDASEQQIDGMIGFEFLNKGIICINFRKKELTVYAFEALNE
ncbi:MAG: aspartyl protease family protein [Cyclobacteriaceae bacterium]|nr:aspartyl protease family protein [Cyclobacteriaceae bacterium]